LHPAVQLLVGELVMEELIHLLRVGDLLRDALILVVCDLLRSVR
jgi:hypothetical protein